MPAQEEVPPVDTPFSRLRARLDEQERGAAEPGPVARRVDRFEAGLKRSLGPVGMVPFPFWILLGLGLGFLLGALYPQLQFMGDWVRNGISAIANVAPLIIFFTLTPALVRMYGTAAAGKFALYVVVGFILTTTIGGLFALLVSLIFFPFMTLGFGAMDLGDQFGSTALATLEAMATEPVFRAIWGALLMSVVLYFGGLYHRRREPVNPVSRMLRTVMDLYTLVGVHGLAALGRVVKAVMPLILFLLGIWFMTGATGDVRAALEGVEGVGEPIWEPLQAYLVSIGVLIVITLLWLLFVSLALTAYTKFPIKRLFSQYIAVVYPFAWATSSSAASLPLNLATTRDALGVRPQVRSFVLPVGATANLDGTMMAAVVGTVVAAKMVGYDVSVIDFLFAMIPLILITIGTPGVPGGLAVVAAPIMATILPLPPGTTGAFMVIFVALLVGPNDMFRTAVNVLDNGFLALLLDKWWPERFAIGAEVNPWLPINGGIRTIEQAPAGAAASGVVGLGEAPSWPDSNED